MMSILDYKVFCSIIQKQEKYFLVLEVSGSYVRRWQEKVKEVDYESYTTLKSLLMKYGC